MRRTTTLAVPPAARAALAATLLLAPAPAASPPGDDLRVAPDPPAAAELLEHVEFLAADALEGREAGTRGERLAAAYIVSRLEQIGGLEPGGTDGWFQPFRLVGPESIEARNVIALLPGADPALAHETIVIGAHYDHVGAEGGAAALDGDTIHNGADDNASGTAGVLELAEMFATAPRRPRRTLAFHFYTGEEKGLLGSLHYVAVPTRPLQDTVLMLNMDMIGRLTGRTLMIGGTGTSPGFSAMCARLVEASGLRWIEVPVGSAPSDNASFSMNDVPALFLFTGVHADYHRAGDDAWKVNAEGMEAVVRLAAAIVGEVDGHDARPPYTTAPGQAEYWGPKPWIGAVFGLRSEAELGAVGVDMITPGSPAEEAGLRVDDRVLAVDGRPVTGLADLEAALSIEVRKDPATHLLRPVLLVVLRARGGAPGDVEVAGGRGVSLQVQPLVR